MAYLNTYNLASQALEVGNAIALGANDVQFSGCCNGLNHAAGTGIINVKAPGVYEVNATVTVTATAAGAIGIQLYRESSAWHQKLISSAQLRALLLPQSQCC